MYSLGAALPKAMSKIICLLVVSSFSALALSSACAIRPHAFGHCKTNFSMTFSYCANVAMFKQMHAVLHTLRQTSHGCRFWDLAALSSRRIRLQLA